MVEIGRIKGLGVCITFSPLFKHIIQIEDLALDLKSIGEAGYKGIELSISDIEDVDWDPFDRHLLENDIELITIATGLVRKLNNISLMDPEPDNRKLAVDRLNKMIKFIGGRSSSSKNVLIGYLKGELSDDNRGYPGSGNINIPEIIRALGEINYCDFLVIECGATPDKKTALTGGYKHMDSILKGGGDLV